MSSKKPAHRDSKGTTRKRGDESEKKNCKKAKVCSRECVRRGVRREFPKHVLWALSRDIKQRVFPDTHFNLDNMSSYGEKDKEEVIEKLVCAVQSDGLFKIKGDTRKPQRLVCVTGC